jgi:hypothetical protein
MKNPAVARQALLGGLRCRTACAALGIHDFNTLVLVINVLPE